MTEYDTDTQPESAPVMGLAARVVGAFVSPERLFRHLVHRPSWIAVVLLVALFVGILKFARMSTATGQDVLEQAIRDRVRAIGVTVSEDRIARQVRMARIAGPLVGFVTLPITAVLVAALVHLLFSVALGGDATFRQVLAVCAHVFPITMVRSLVATLLVFLTGSYQATTSLAAFLPVPEAEGLAYGILQGIDPFWIWQVGLLAVGTSVLYRFPPKRCAVPLFGTYLVFVVAVAGIRAWLA
ncbi:MAG: YIP1 family protein [Acidobacteria bacterium]|nr:YIP1 family protein [Acidobacteriota bacterium]